MIVLWAAAAYLLGSVPFGVLLARRLTGVNLLEEGSRNSGATNVARSVGVGAGLLTLFLDAGKGALPAAAALAAGLPRWQALLVGVSAVLGHVFSPWLAFRGGKGVATGLGVFAVAAPLGAAVAIGIFLVVVAVTRWVSLGSLLATASVPLTLAGLGRPKSELWLAIATGSLIVWRHRENISRLARGTEPRFGRSRGGVR